ncbi:hypothetical protein GN244_ATG16109 [Phytophthora infestans]|uniref:Uncharacterized protein n=1 Tax=Phytophthora infestans TaxID=4787 RepID=A0A833WN24_PHYIN|nr:hypothetical protein GN244_ATG16109 [Phytophthora infestans]
MTNEETRRATVRTPERTARATIYVAEEVRTSIPDEHDATGETHQEDERVRRCQRPLGIESQRAVSTITGAEVGSDTRPLDTAKGRSLTKDARRKPMHNKDVGSIRGGDGLEPIARTPVADDGSQEPTKRTPHDQTPGGTSETTLQLTDQHIREAQTRSRLM